MTSEIESPGLQDAKQIRVFFWAEKPQQIVFPCSSDTRNFWFLPTGVMAPWRFTLSVFDQRDVGLAGRGFQQLDQVDGLDVAAREAALAGGAGGDDLLGVGLAHLDQAVLG